VGGWATETKVMQSSSLIIYIQSIINEQSFIIDHYQLAFITSDYVINYYVQLTLSIMVNHNNHYWCQSSSSTIIYQSSLAVYTIINDYHESSIFNHHL